MCTPTLVPAAASGEPPRLALRAATTAAPSTTTWVTDTGASDEPRQPQLVPGARVSSRAATIASPRYTAATANAAAPPNAIPADAATTSIAPSVRTASGDAGSPAAVAAEWVPAGRRIFARPANAS